MDELKVYHCNEWHNEYTEFYMKYEADRVIAEKDKEIDLYKRGWKESDIINANLYAELRHQKCKRCLAMAKMCDVLALFYGNAVPKVLNKDITDPNRQRVFRRLSHYKKWCVRWLELAEQFKEAK